jgi:hypothetical protein
VVGVVSCGSRLVHTPIAPNILACMIPRADDGLTNESGTEKGRPERGRPFAVRLLAHGRVVFLQLTRACREFS